MTDIEVSLSALLPGSFCQTGILTERLFGRGASATYVL